MKGDPTMKEQNVALEWFRAKHDELAGTARANLDWLQCIRQSDEGRMT